jgi:hypothetical protein
MEILQEHHSEQHDSEVGTKVVIPFFGKYEPAMIQRFGNSSPKYNDMFQKEIGIEQINFLESGGEFYDYYKIVDEQLFFLAKVKYGF